MTTKVNQSISVSKKSIKGMNFSQKSKLAHKIAKTLQGDYFAKLKLAWEYITFNPKRKKHVATINNLLKSTNTNDNNDKQPKADKRTTKQAKAVNDTPKQQRTTQPKRKEEEKETYTIDIATINNETYRNIAQTNLLVSRYTSKKDDTTYITTEYAYYINYIEAIDTLNNTSDNDTIKMQLLSVIASDYIKHKANKYHVLGLSHKKLENTEQLQKIENDYYYHKSNASMLSINFQEVSDTVNDSILYLFDKLKEKDLEHVSYFFSNISFSIYNVLRKEVYRKKFHSNMKIDTIYNNDDENTAFLQVFSDNDYFNNDREKHTREYNNAMQELDSMDFNDKEKQAISLRLQGYKQKEVSKAMNVTQRFWKRVNDKLNVKAFKEIEKHAYKMETVQAYIESMEEQESEQVNKSRKQA